MNLPIAERELRVAARMPRTYRARLIACVIFGVITGWMFWFSSKVAPLSTIAPQTYAFVAHMALLMCMFSTNVTADALSSEKRNGTLGLLFLTDLKGRDIVFGKLAAFGLVALYGVLGVIPLLAMPVLMGGISGQTVLRTGLTLMNGLFMALSLGLWVSSRSWDQKRAMNGAVWLVICLLWVLPGLATATRFRYPKWAQVADVVFMISPMYQQQHSNPFGIGMITDKYWWSLGISHALAWLALWRACAILPRAWQDRAIMSARGRFKKFWEELRFGSPEVRALHRMRLLRISAIHWLSGREKSAPAAAWFFVLCVIVGWVGIWLWINAQVSGTAPFWGVGIPAVFIMALVLRIRVSAVASEFIARDRFSGALELLLSTIVTEKDVARGLLLTVTRTFLGPAIAIVILSLPVFLGVLSENQARDTTPVWVVYLGLLALFPVDLAASYWTGMWMACIARAPAAAPGQAIIRLVIFPWFFFVAIMTIGSILRLGNDFEFADVFAGWWLLCMANNIFWIVRSKRNFYERLRICAAERYQPSASKKRWWKFFLARRSLTRNRLV
jgi:hypothetical protein